MKWRQEIPQPADDEIRELEALVRAGTERQLSSPPDAYMANLIVRTNKRIDEVSSGKGITISWAARVAMPGVVALLSFLIGLHYYIPGEHAARESLDSIVIALPEAVVDSILSDPSRLAASERIELLAEPLLEVPQDQLSDYFIEEASGALLLQSLDEESARSVLIALTSNVE